MNLFYVFLNSGEDLLQCLSSEDLYTHMYMYVHHWHAHQTKDRSRYRMQPIGCLGLLTLITVFLKFLWEASARVQKKKINVQNTTNAGSTACKETIAFMVGGRGHKKLSENLDNVIRLPMGFVVG